MFPIKALAFLKRDLIESATYKSALLLNLLQILSNIIIFFFISKLVHESSPEFAQNYGSSYFGFALIGIALSSYQLAGLRGFGNAIAREQSSGTLEAILVSKTSLLELILIGSFWQFIAATLRIIVYLVLGAIFFQLDLSALNPMGVFTSMLLTIFSLAGLGLISAGYLLAFKRGDPVIVVLNSLSKLLAGVYFPAALLPSWAENISAFFPLKHSLDAMRRALFQNCGIYDLKDSLIILLIFSFTLLPTGTLFFRWAIKKTLRDGSLVHI